MSTKKKFDLTTLFVVLVSITLILLGMYFLNQSFTKKSPSIKSELATNQAKSSIATAVSSITTQISSSEIKINSSETAVSSTAISSSSINTSSSNSSSTSSSSKNNSPLSTSEAKVKVLQSLGNGSYEVQIIETGVKEPKFWIKEKKLKINNNSILKIDTEYRIGEIIETSNSFNYGSIEE